MYQYKYLDGLEEPQTEAMAIGTAIHKALEWWPNNAKADSGLDTPFVNGILDAVKRPPWVVMQPEAKFEIETDKGVIRGAIDGLVWHKDAMYVLERKTTSMSFEMLKQLKTFDRQTTLYYYGARSLGHEPAGIVLDVIVKPRIRQGKNESPEQYRTRVACATQHSWDELYKTEKDLENAEKDVEEVIDLIQLGKFPRNPGSCYKYNRLCPFFAKCASS
jgi:hypothetical protein